MATSLSNDRHARRLAAGDAGWSTGPILKIPADQGSPHIARHVQGVAMHSPPRRMGKYREVTIGFGTPIPSWRSLRQQL